MRRSYTRICVRLQTLIFDDFRVLTGGLYQNNLIFIARGQVRQLKIQTNGIIVFVRGKSYKTLCNLTNTGSLCRLRTKAQINKRTDQTTVLAASVVLENLSARYDVVNYDKVFWPKMQKFHWLCLFLFLFQSSCCKKTLLCLLWLSFFETVFVFFYYFSRKLFRQIHTHALENCFRMNQNKY